MIYSSAKTYKLEDSLLLPLSFVLIFSIIPPLYYRVYPEIDYYDVIKFLSNISFFIFIYFSYKFRENKLKNIGYYTKRVMASPWFNRLTSIAIISYSVVIFSDRYIENSGYGFLLVVFDMLITNYFIFEIFIRYNSYEDKYYFFKNRWNLFDSTIVLLSIVPIGYLSSLLFLRVFRLFKVIRIFSANKDLRKVVEALFASVMPISAVILFLIVVMFVYSVIGNLYFGNMISPSGATWASVGDGLIALTKILTMEGWTTEMYEFQKTHPWSWVYFISFVLLAGLVVISLFTAVIVEEIQKFQQESMINYTGYGHFVIININKKIQLVLQELDIHFKTTSDFKDVVILSDNLKDIKYLNNNLDFRIYKNMTIYIKYGDVLEEKTLEERVSIDKARGVLILSDKNEDEKFLSDNKNLSIVSALMKNKSFSKNLVDDFLKNIPKKCTLEIADTINASNTAKNIVSMLSKDYIERFGVENRVHNDNYFVPISPVFIVNKILKLSIKNKNYLSFFNETLKAGGHNIHFVNPEDLVGKNSMFLKSLHEKQDSYETVKNSLKGGILIGLSYVGDKGFDIALNGKDHKDQKLQVHFKDKNNQDMYRWLLVITKEKESLRLENPKEVEDKSIFVDFKYIQDDISEAYVIGNNIDIDDSHFGETYHDIVLDETNQPVLKEIGYSENRLIHEDTIAKELKYAPLIKLDTLVKAAKEDKQLIINLDDEIGYRLMIFLLSRLQKDSFDRKDFYDIGLYRELTQDEFLREKIKTHQDNISIIISSKKYSSLLNRISINKSSVIFSDEIMAQFITQVFFQKTTSEAINSICDSKNGVKIAQLNEDARYKDLKASIDKRSATYLGSVCNGSFRYDYGENKDKILKGTILIILGAEEY